MKVRHCLGVLAVAGVLAAAPLEAADTPKPVVTITAHGLRPRVLMVVPGTTVTWHNTDHADRRMVSVRGLFDSTPIEGRGRDARGGVYRYLFNDPGRFGYVVNGRPTRRGTIVVREPGPPQRQVSPPIAREEVAAFDPRPYVGRGNSYDCTDFASQATAQKVLHADHIDPNKLDADWDGIACEDNGAPYDRRQVHRRGPDNR